MFKKITALSLVGGLFITGAFAYTSADVTTANYLANRGIIRDWSGTPANYGLENRIARAEIMGMVLEITGVTRNTTCRGDFADVRMYGTNADWVCRTVETAADHGYINAMAGVSRSFRLVRPYDNITRSEALGMLMKAFPDNGAYAGYSYYWNSNFPVDGETQGYRNFYAVGSEWQAKTFYDYTRKVLNDDTQLRIDPRVNAQARLKEVFGFAKNIMEKRG